MSNWKSIYPPGTNSTIEYTHSNKKVYFLVDKRKHHLCLNCRLEHFLIHMYMCNFLFDKYFMFYLHIQFQFLKSYFPKCMPMYVLIGLTPNSETFSKASKTETSSELYHWDQGLFPWWTNGRECNNNYPSCMDYSNSSEIYSLSILLTPSQVFQPTWHYSLSYHLCSTHYKMPKHCLLNFDFFS